MRIRIPSGSLNKYTCPRNGKIYPIVDGDRDENNPQHWNWVYTYKVRTPSGRFTTVSANVPRIKLIEVKALIHAGESIATVLNLLRKSK